MSSSASTRGAMMSVSNLHAIIVAKIHVDADTGEYLGMAGKGHSEKCSNGPQIGEEYKCNGKLADAKSKWNKPDASNKEIDNYLIEQKLVDKYFTKKQKINIRNRFKRIKILRFVDSIIWRSKTV